MQTQQRPLGRKEAARGELGNYEHVIMLDAATKKIDEFHQLVKYGVWIRSRLWVSKRECWKVGQPMILLQQVGFPPLPPPETPPSLPMSVATRPTATLPLSPPKPLGPGPSLPLAQDEELATRGEQDPLLEELCKPLCCRLCNVTLNSAQQAQAHYQGKNHSKKLRNYYAANSCPASARVSNSLEPATHPMVSLAPQGSSPKPGGRVILATENDYCKLCDASFSSPAVAQAHYQGKNHAKRLRLAEAQNNSFLESSEMAGKRKARKEGNEFKMMQNRRNVYAVQNNTGMVKIGKSLWYSPGLSQAIPQQFGPYFNPRSRQRIPRDLAMCVTPSGQFYCSMCNAGASEEMEFRQHLESKQHKSKVSEQRYKNEMENLGYVQ
ncbi:zinc finger matrin-type protein 3 isoform X3 [Crotalus tigris]|uniref:zinc finger matrin-type protein 3 isoform X3 n=1 Tax=Crotalus tigris TaxID=88082 RepID=UPI00192F5C1D|nr:zinc finger matrin-type protein 3 isoform X3 [Crotalus tigris]